MGKKILIVDDSATVRQQVRMALEGAGFDVEEAVDGLDGKERIGKSSQLAAVVCDVNMPRMNGIEMIESVKASSEASTMFSDTPTVDQRLPLPSADSTVTRVTASVPLVRMRTLKSTSLRSAR